MQKIYAAFIVLVLCLSCDDGDIITVALDFEDTFEACGALVVYKTKSNPNESLSLQITSPVTTIESLIETEVDATNPLLVNLVSASSSISINSANSFNYRTYTAEPLNVFCNDIPPANLGITQDFSSNVGDALFEMELIEDDNDGIPAELEDINGNGDLTDDDTDGDGLANYIDDDDDGDNVRTVLENPNYSAADGLSLAQDSDLDSIPDYLDTDDDNDMVLTRDEENFTADQNPANDITNSMVGPDYLNDQINTTVPATAYRAHSIDQTFVVRLTISGIDLSILTQEVLEFGTLSDPLTNKTRSVSPTF